MTPDAIALCAQLRAAIIRAGWSETARRAGMDRTALHRAFPATRGSSMPTMKTVAAVTNALGMRLSLTRGVPS